VRYLLTLLCFALCLAAQQTESTRVLQADAAFQTGKYAVQRGDIPTARKEFDRAIDVLLSVPESSSERRAAEQRLEQLIELIYRLDVNTLGSGADDQEVVFDTAPIDEIRELTFPVDPQLRKQVSRDISKIQSEIPLTVNDSVLGFINYFNNSERGRSTLMGALKRSGRYREMIYRILKEEGVPLELLYLAQAESGFKPRAVSIKAAVGMWQFISDTGRRYKLRQTELIDERLDPEKATRAAARYLKDLRAELGDWHLAVAAYNCGEGCVGRSVERTGYADYWELRSRKAIPRETTNYVPIIIALTIMLKNPQEYNLQEAVYDPPLELDRITLSADTSLQLVADAANVSLADLREWNPSVLRSLAPQGYEVFVPKGQGAATLQALHRVPEQYRDNWRLHRVEGGDTLAGIAAEYQSSSARIEEANPAMRELRAGEWLAVPYTPPPPPVARYVRVKKRGKWVLVKVTPRVSRARGGRIIKASRSSARVTRGKARPVVKKTAARGKRRR
jgi:membrane-bound lytic murein transglycosylase D